MIFTNKQILAILQLIDREDDPSEYDEDFNPMDASGGNFDDAYQMGISEGRAELAYQIRKILGVNRDVENE